MAYQMIRAWIPGTRIRLVSVPWDAQYRDVVEWGSVAARDQWFDNLTGDGFEQPADTYTYLRPFDPVDIGMPFNKVNRYNYLMVDNPPMEGDTTRRLYYFITGIEYLTPQTTRIRLQLDVWTTYAPTTKWGRSYIERGHLGIANGNATTDPKSLREYQSVPEDLDVGDTLAVSHQDVWGLFAHAAPGREAGVMYIVVCSADLQADPGTVDKPNQQTAVPRYYDWLPNGCQYLAFDADDWSKFLSAARAYSWISRNIQAIYCVPKGLTRWTQADWQLNLKYGGVHAYTPSDTLPSTFATIHPIGDIMNAIPERYRIVKKLLTYPYSVIELSGCDGSPVFYKPQLLNGMDTGIDFVGNAVLPFTRYGFYLRGYGDNGAGSKQVDHNPIPNGPSTGRSIQYCGDTLDSAVWFDNWPQFSIVNDMYINYLANTAYTRAYSYESAGWARTKGTAALDMQRNVTESQLATNQANQDIQNQLTDRSRIADLITGAAGVLGTGATGNIGGTIQAGLGLGANMYKSVIGQQAQNQQFANNQMQAGMALDANQAYGRRATQGDYQNAINAIQAQVQQAQLTPPSTSGQQGGNGLMLANGGINLRYQVKTMVPGVMSMIGDYFLRYGIAIHRFIEMPEKLNCMTHFSYWRLSEAYIIDSEGDESSRDTMRGIMQKGVTIWDKPESIGRTSLYDNQPKTGYGY